MSSAAPRAQTAGRPARQGAHRLLAGVLSRRETLADQIEAGALAALPPEERARAQSLATLTLRHLAPIDDLLGGYLKKAPHGAAMTILRTAVAELLLDGVAAHAAVNDAVALARQDRRAGRFAGLINAVLRRVAAEKPTLGPPRHPRWFAERLSRHYGAEAEVAMAQAHAAGAPTDLSLRDPGERAEVVAALEQAGVAVEILPTGSLRLGQAGQISKLPGYDTGRWWVQDAAAALPARLAGEVAGKRVLDLCAAPGGKTQQLAAAGALLTALDASEKRLGRLRENLARTGLSAEVVCADALAWTPNNPFDLVLLDAPCSATGTVRRHPDLPHVRDDGALAPLLELQAALLAAAARAVASGGQLIYSVCSLLPEEGEEQLTRFRETHPAFQPETPPTLGLPEGWRDGATLRTRPDYWPERGGLDGFFMGCLVHAP
ncbi:MAG: transcription antitermination factor NusB [Pseudomonadota bacterium]